MRKCSRIIAVKNLDGSVGSLDLSTCKSVCIDSTTDSYAESWLHHTPNKRWYTEEYESLSRTSWKRDEVSLDGAMDWLIDHDYLQYEELNATPLVLTNDQPVRFVQRV
jgi:hypothetical protein